MYVHKHIVHALIMTQMHTLLKLIIDVTVKKITFDLTTLAYKKKRKIAN